MWSDINVFPERCLGFGEAARRGRGGRPSSAGPDPDPSPRLPRQRIRRAPPGNIREGSILKKGGAESAPPCSPWSADDDPPPVPGLPAYLSMEEVSLPSGWKDVTILATCARVIEACGASQSTPWPNTLLATAQLTASSDQPSWEASV